MTQWYYADRQRQQHGPIEASTLAGLYRSGRIDLATLVWRDGLAQWQPLSSVRDELSLEPPAPAPPVASAAGPDADAGGVTLDLRHALGSEPKAGPASPADAPAAGPEPAEGERGWATLDLRQPVEPVASPYAAPAVVDGASEAPVQGGEVVLAGFWKRVAAYVIDSMIVGVVGGVIGMFLGILLVPAMALGGDGGSAMYFGGQLLIQLFSIALSAAYYGWFHASRNQATLGKMAIGIKVVRSDGSRITLARGIARYFATILSGLTLCIGFLMAAFTERKQGLHDMLCDTLVVDKWAFTEHPEWQRRELGTVALVVLILYGALLLLVGVAVVVAMGALLSMITGGWS